MPFENALSFEYEIGKSEDKKVKKATGLLKKLQKATRFLEKCSEDSYGQQIDAVESTESHYDYPNRTNFHLLSDHKSKQILTVLHEYIRSRMNSFRVQPHYIFCCCSKAGFLFL